MISRQRFLLVAAVFVILGVSSIVECLYSLLGPGRESTISSVVHLCTGILCFAMIWWLWVEKRTPTGSHVAGEIRYRQLTYQSTIALCMAVVGFISAVFVVKADVNRLMNLVWSLLIAREGLARIRHEVRNPATGCRSHHSPEAAACSRMERARASGRTDILHPHE